MKNVRYFVILICLFALAIGKPAQAQDAISDEHFNALIATAKDTMLRDPERAQAAAAEARAYAAKLPPSRQRALMNVTTDWLIGETFNRISANAKARPIIARALTNVVRVAPQSRLHADILLTQGTINAAFGDVGRALHDLQQAHTIFRNLGYNRGRAKVLIQIAILYYDANDYAATIKYHRQAAELIGDDPGIAVAIHNGIGNAFKDMGDYPKAQEQYEQAVQIAKSLHSAVVVSIVQNNLARVALLANNLAVADHAIVESIRHTGPEVGSDFRRSQTALRAQLALQRGHVALAEALIRRAFAGVDVAKTTLDDRPAHQTAYDVFRRSDEPALALAHLAALKRLDDDATTLARSNSAALMAARFDFANQELRIAQLKTDDLQKSVGFERARARTQRLIFGGVVAAILAILSLLLFALVAIRRSRNEVRSVNADLAAGNTALAKALAAKSEFLAVTSHEIRTPLNGILGMTQVMLADRQLDPAVSERVELIHGAGTTMRVLVDDILDVAKIETGKLALEQAPFDLRELVQQSCRLWEEAIRAKGIDFTVELDACPGAIVGDLARVRQILFNLLGNAVKFTSDGAIRVVARRGADERLTITVRDSGIGIPPEKQAEIFESFRQVDAGTTRQFGGTGLGLAICRSLARAMDGDVTVSSRLGEGATFTLDLPLHEAASVAGAPPPVQRAAYLIVDRNPIGRAMYRTLLLDVVGDVAPLDSLAGARAYLARERVTGVLVDEATLRAGGEVSAEIQALVAAAGGAGVTVLWPDDDPAAATIRAAGACVLAKPVARAQLVAHVSTQLVADAETQLVPRAA